jgi:hypothetical protein
MSRSTFGWQWPKTQQVQQSARVNEKAALANAGVRANLLQQQRFVLSGRERHLVVNIDRGVFIVGVDLRVCDDPVATGHLAPALLHLVRQQAVGLRRGGVWFKSHRALGIPGIEL